MTSLANARALYLASGIALAMCVLMLLPISANAQTVTVTVKTETQQMLPPGPGPNTCTPLEAPIIKPYVYDGELHSFDMYLSDPSYVAIAGSVGKTALPMNFMTRQFNAEGHLRIHVDTPSIPLRDANPVSITLVSSLPGRPTCLTQVTASLSGTEVAKAATATTKVAPAPEKKRVDGAAGIKAGKETALGKKFGDEKKKEAGAQPDVKGESKEVAAVSGSIEANKTLDRICSAERGAARLWTILLAVYFLIIAATILALPDGKLSRQSSILLLLAIAVPLGVLFAVWKVAPVCRVGAWAPFGSVLVALMGLILGFRHHPIITKIFALPKSR